jgi:hypothetical protein
MVNFASAKTFGDFMSIKIQSASFKTLCQTMDKEFYKEHLPVEKIKETFARVFENEEFSFSEKTTEKTAIFFKTDKTSDSPKVVLKFRYHASEYCSMDKTNWFNFCEQRCEGTYAKPEDAFKEIESELKIFKQFCILVEQIKNTPTDKTLQDKLGSVLWT